MQKVRTAQGDPLFIGNKTRQLSSMQKKICQLKRLIHGEYNDEPFYGSGT